MQKKEPEDLSFLQTMSSVLASFIGVQSNAKRERDFTRGKASSFILVGLLLTVGFILAVLGVVMLVMHFAT
jgi:hypothetical protein